MLTDLDLLKQISTGDQLALTAFYERHHGFCVRYASTIVYDPVEVDDVVQEVFLSVWTSASRFDASRARPVTWLRTIVHNRAVDHIRQTVKDRSTPAGSLHDLEANTVELVPEPFEQLWASEKARRVRTLMDLLPQRQRDILILAYFSGHSQSRIATITGVPLGTVKTRAVAAQRALAKMLREFDGAST